MASWDGVSPRVWEAKHLRFATDAAGVALWSWNVDTDEIAMDDRAHRLWGVPKRGGVTFEELSARIHPADLDRVRSAFQATRAVLGSYDIDFRILEGDATRWISARGRGDDMGIVGRIMFGVFLDVTERKRAEELHELLAREMSHRVKNLFALAAALSTISARSTSSSEEMAKDFTQRLTSLSHAHDLVRPNAGEADGRTTFLQDMFEVLLAPYDDRTRRRIHIALPNVPVGEGAVTALALIVHELATNSMKYGALSAAAGNIKIFGAVDADEVSLTWRERGGPAVPGRPERTGFGSVLVSQSISGQLGGSIRSDWPTEGIMIWLTINKARLVETR